MKSPPEQADASPSLEPPPSALLSPSQSPSTSSFTAMYSAHYAEVLRFVRRRAHPLNVDDVVSDTFTAAWLRRSDLPDPALPWLYRTARNVMLNTTRGGSRQRALAVRLAGEHPGTVSSGIDDLESRLDLEALFRSLPERDQEILALDVWEQLDAHAAARLPQLDPQPILTLSTRDEQARDALLTHLVASDPARDLVAHRRLAHGRHPRRARRAVFAGLSVAAAAGAACILVVTATAQPPHADYALGGHIGLASWTQTPTPATATEADRRRAPASSTRPSTTRRP